MLHPLEWEARGHLIMLYLILGACKRGILQCYLMKHGGDSQKLWPVSIFFARSVVKVTLEIYYRKAAWHMT